MPISSIPILMPALYPPSAHLPKNPGVLDDPSFTKRDARPVTTWTLQLKLRDQV